MSKRSPGPWHTRESATHVTVTNARGDAVFHDDKRIPGVMADAHLIAAAPELLVALEELCSCPQWVDEATVPKAGIEAAPQQVVVNMSVALLKLRKARAVIAKATGETT